MTERSVWTRLVDSDGNPYKGSGSSCVKFSDQDFIALFAEEIHSRNAPILTGIVSSQLRVYKTLNDLKQNQPLKSSALMEGLGLDEESALIVVVPSPDPSLTSNLCLVNSKNFLLF